MDYVYLAILFILSGFFMKLSDDEYDINNNLILATFFGVLCGLACAIASVSDVGSAYIFIAIAIGNLLAFKVDGIHHFVTFVIFAAICFTCGIPQLSIIVLLILILAALGDEVGHELINNYTENKFIQLFFEYRFVMKVVIFILVLCGAFSFWTFIFFILFEVSYTMAGVVFKKVE
jgi:hypothetical protein